METEVVGTRSALRTTGGPGLACSSWAALSCWCSCLSSLGVTSLSKASCGLRPIALLLSAEDDLEWWFALAAVFISGAEVLTPTGEKSLWRGSSRILMGIRVPELERPFLANFSMSVH